LPAWHQLLRAYRRLEAQGHVRGGRFVGGVSGEQYALPDAVGSLRAIRKRGAEGEWIALSAADPLNLAGIVTPGPRVAALAGNRLLLRDGVTLATYCAGEVQFHQELAAHEQWQARNALLRKAAGGAIVSRVFSAPH
jgi:ATP-dependent Lhr-like helicase